MLCRDYYPHVSTQVTSGRTIQYACPVAAHAGPIGTCTHNRGAWCLIAATIGKTLIPRRIIQLHVLALNYWCSTSCHNIMVGKLVRLRISAFRLHASAQAAGCPPAPHSPAHNNAILCPSSSACTHPTHPLPSCRKAISRALHLFRLQTVAAASPAASLLRQ
jgi:hypothetical protein